MTDKIKKCFEKEQNQDRILSINKKSSRKAALADLPGPRPSMLALQMVTSSGFPSSVLQTAKSSDFLLALQTERRWDF